MMEVFSYIQHQLNGIFLTKPFSFTCPGWGATWVAVGATATEVPNMGVVRPLTDGTTEEIGTTGTPALGDGDGVGVATGTTPAAVVEVIPPELVACGWDDGAGDGWTVWELTPALEFDDGDDATDTTSVDEGWILETGFGVVADAVGAGNSSVALPGCTLGFGLVGMRLVLFVGGLVVSLVRPFATFCAMLDTRTSVLSWWWILCFAFPLWCLNLNAFSDSPLSRLHERIQRFSTI